MIPLSMPRARRRLLARFPFLGVVMLALASLTACGTTLAGASTPTPSATPANWTTAAPGTVLFQADWSKGLADWQASDGWTVRDGALETDGLDNRTLTIPYQPIVRDYAVIFSAQVVDEPKDGGYFRLVAPTTQAAPGYHAEVQGLHTDLLHPNGDHPHAWVLLDPRDAQDDRSFHTTDYEPRHTMWNYHVEVRGNAVQFKRDSTSFSAAVAITEGPLSHGPLRIECGLAFLRFGSLQIVAL
jgi:hypothetical protein